MDCKTSRHMRVADWNALWTNICKLHYWCTEQSDWRFFGGEGGGGGIPPEYTFWISCSCNAIYMHLHTILWWCIMRFATLVSLRRTWVDHRYFPHVGPESTCCSINKKFDPWNSRQNKLKSQLYRLKTLGLSLGFHELWYLKKTP